MKNLIVIMFAVLSLYSCKKDPDGGNAIINPSASMNAKINGSEWSALTRIVTLQNSKFIITGTGSITGNNVVAITILGETAGTYNLNATQGQAQFTANFTPVASSTDSIYQAYEGVVTLTEVDAANQKISGTFSFKMRLVTNLNNEITVTEGAFTSLGYSL